MTTVAPVRRRGRPATITREAIVDAAARRDSDPWTVTELAASLGVSQAAIYHYFPSKQAVLAAVGERLMTTIVLPTAEGGWAATLTRLGQAWFEAMCRHPVLLDLGAARESEGSPAGMALAERTLATLLEAGLDPRHAMDAFSLVTLAAMSYARLQVEVDRRPPTPIRATTAVAQDLIETFSDRGIEAALQAALRIIVAGVGALPV